MKTIIAGSRDIEDYDLLVKTIVRSEYIITSIISGNARGPDKMGATYARNNNIDLIVMPADWDKYGKSAGIKRNIAMGEIAEQAIFLWDGESRGTKHMIDYMKQNNKPYSLLIKKKK